MQGQQGSRDFEEKVLTNSAWEKQKFYFIDLFGLQWLFI